jgi:hypothetical protein
LNDFEDSAAGQRRGGFEGAFERAGVDGVEGHRSEPVGEAIGLFTAFFIE